MNIIRCQDAQKLQMHLLLYLKKAGFVVSDVVFVMNRFGYVKLVDKALFDKNEEQLRSEKCAFCAM